jgi:aldose 1-epimerase
MSDAVDLAAEATLTHAGWSVAVSLRTGAVMSCDYRGVEVLRSQAAGAPAQDPFDSAHFPLAPYSNRIRNGRFTFAGKTYSILPNAPGQDHPLHGTAWLGRWEEVARTAQAVTLRFENEPEKDGWPWPFALTQRIAVEDGAFVIGLEVKNTGAAPMPSGLGFHPYFSDPAAASISFAAEGVWLADEEGLPVRWAKEPPEWDFAGGKPLKGLAIDHCFTGWRGPAAVEWRNRPYTVEIEADEGLPFAVVFVSDALDCFCFEPVSHMNDALNWAGRTPDAGLRTLAPGEIHSAVMRLRIREPRSKGKRESL